MQEKVINDFLQLKILEQKQKRWEPTKKRKEKARKKKKKKKGKNKKSRWRHEVKPFVGQVAQARLCFEWFRVLDPCFEGLIKYSLWQCLSGIDKQKLSTKGEELLQLPKQKEK